MCQLWALQVVIKSFLTFIFAVFLLNLFYRCMLSHKHIYGFVKKQTQAIFTKNRNWKQYSNTTSGFKFLVNRTFGDVVMTSRINFRLQVGSAHVLRRSISVSVPNFVKISHSTASYNYFRLRKTNGRHTEILLQF